MDIYSIDIKTIDTGGSFALLSPEEKSRTQAFGNETARLRFIHTRALVRKLLAERLGVDPHSLHFESTPSGKPYLKNKACYFNISHSADLVAVALADNDVGLDIEYMKKRNYIALAKYCLQSKVPLIRGASEPLREFYRWWTTFEAGIKLAGLSAITHKDSYPEHCYTAAKGKYMLSVATAAPAEINFSGVIAPPFDFHM